MEFNIFWDNVWSFEHHYKNKNNSKELPWDIYTHDPELEKVLKNISIEKNDKALDIGCGLGYDSVYLASKGLKVTGIDISKNAIVLASKLNSNLNVEYITSDLFNYEEKIKFNLVYDRGCFHNNHYMIDEYFKKVNKLITDNGNLIIITGNSNLYYKNSLFTKPETVKISQIEKASCKYFNIFLVQEINFMLNPNYENTSGWLFWLKPKEHRFKLIEE